MTKVVINVMGYGLNLSSEATARLSELIGEEPKYFWGWEDLERHDPRLLQVVEELGGEAAGDLTVVDLGDAKQYRIQYYEGPEWVETPDTIEWVNV